MRMLSIHVAFFHYCEVGPHFLCEIFYLLIGSWLLIHELGTRKSEHLQTERTVLVMYID